VLNGYQGIIVADGYGTYEALARAWPRFCSRQSRAGPRRTGCRGLLFGICLVHAALSTAASFSAGVRPFRAIEKRCSL
jgi:hypothetical protein